jgi:hypothetical protein
LDGIDGVSLGRKKRGGLHPVEEELVVGVVEVELVVERLHVWGQFLWDLCGLLFAAVGVGVVHRGIADVGVGRFQLDLEIPRWVQIGL